MKSLRFANLCFANLRLAGLGFAGLLTTLTAFSALPAAAQDTRHISIIHTFAGGHTTGNPTGDPLTADSAGNLYGVTFWGGNFHGCSDMGCGVAYRLTPATGGGYTTSILYKFPGGTQGAEPSHLTLDAAGNLYGVLSSGGLYGGGAVFELSPTSSGPWTFTTLYSFPINSNFEYPNGELPTGGVIFDSAGNMYGTTAYGGTFAGGLGTVYEMSPNGSGGWNQTVLYSMEYTATHPNGPLTFDAAGNLYGTSAGGDGENGVVFKLTPVTGGGWTYSTIYSFTGGSDGSAPEAGLTLDAAGNLYGTTATGGALHNSGTVFELSPTSGGAYTFNLVYTFQGLENSGNSYFPVTLDSSGNLYGSANGGPTDHGYVFELSPSASGWTFGLVHGFTGGADGQQPGALILDSTGALYGTTAYGATPGCINDSGCGTVFKLAAPAGARK